MIYYWVGNTGRIDDPAHYSLESGGEGGAGVPGEGDYGVIDENSFTKPGQYIMFPLGLYEAMGADASIATISAPETSRIEETPLTEDGHTLDADASIGTISAPEVHNYETIGTVTFATGTPGLVTASSAHGLIDNQPVYFTTTGILPDEITARTVYYAHVIDTTTFRTRVVVDGDPMDYTGTPSGTHTCYKEV